MENNIISLIAEAESTAATKKSQALSESAQIVAAAEKEAQEIAKRSALECAQLREEMIKCAEEKAASDYDRAISDSTAKAKAYADSKLASAENFVLEIVRRLAK